jgi:hypothetical protein
MKLKSLFLTLMLVMLYGCNTDLDDNTTQTTVSLKFAHHWDGVQVKNSGFNAFSYTNAHGTLLSIERLRYLISDVVLTKNNGQVIAIEGYSLVDLSNENTLEYSPTDLIETGTYSNISFVFGFKNEKNIDGSYTDLNAESWNAPSMLGGGYHYMQMDGKFLNAENEEQGYNYHAIRAAENPGESPSFPQDTFFKVDLGAVIVEAGAKVNIAMNIAEWFKNPNSWSLDNYNQMLMPNSEAQIMMYENGQNVFTLALND